MTIQNHGVSAHWARAFAGQTRCTSAPISYLQSFSYHPDIAPSYNRYWTTPCVTIRSDGSFYATASGHTATIYLNHFSTPDEHVNTSIPLPAGSGTIVSNIAPIYDRWNGGTVTSWAVYGVSQ